jgi:beta-galactosidase
VVVSADSAPRSGSRAEFSLKTQSITLQAGEVRKVVASGAWATAHLWNPDDPFLYVLKSRVTEGGNTLDTQGRQFGFREIWIQGNQYWYNGHRLNLRGDSFTHHFSNTYIQNNDVAAYTRIIDRVKKMNINFVRYHTGPARPYVLDICDEKGLFVMWETPVYSRGYMIGANIPQYLENSRKFMEPFVKAARIHPSIVIWSAENEFGRNYIRVMTDSEMRSLGEAMTKWDPTRPINYDGEMDIGAETVNLHYRQCI